ncbi:MAG: histone deacetylase [Phycisphaerales bacterium]|nr:MAG: histone deacetylase [Phycisphaerales bacterium]
MANTGLAQDERFQEHLTGPGHPERPQRLAHVAAALKDRGLAEACAPVEILPIDMTLVGRIHEDGYLERVRRACADGLPYIDVPDSGICPESFRIAQLAAGAVINAVNDVMAGKIDNAFCAVRPPGHHAERHMSMGFCLLNNIAIAARYLLDIHGLSRVLILDWDVHHGNGTQHTFEADPRVLYVSLHGHPGVVYPGTGYEQERGRGEGEGFTINLPMLPPAGDDEYRRAFGGTILGAVEDFDPQFVLISAGFDAHRLDPLAPLELETESFGWMTDELARVARNHCDGKLVSILEGGYHLDALADSLALHVTRLMDA